MKFYDCRVASNPRRVRMFLAEKGIEVPMVDIDIRGGENLKPEYLKINPRGLLPVLELDDGTRLTETIAICRYLEEIQPEPPLMGTDPVSKSVIEAWLRRMEFDGQLPAQDIFRNTFPPFAGRGIPGRENVDQIPALAERGAAALDRFYDDLESRLRTSAYIGGPDFSIADIVGLVAVDFAIRIEHPIPGGNAATLKWHETVSARPSARA